MPPKTPKLDLTTWNAGSIAFLVLSLANGVLLGLGIAVGAWWMVAFLMQWPVALAIGAHLGHVKLEGSPRQPTGPEAA
ncbi:MAG: hypothetical protein QOD77_982 [Thermoplasmata archaeon]|jgi:hypothetical protein|nr:hypothetical protein [Thermoplasmata archaeon]